MKPAWVLTMLLCSAAVPAPSPPVRPDAFAHQARIEASGSGPFHELVLPLAVYQGVRRQDLGDLRVFNAAGEVLPHSLIRAEPTAVAQTQETALPLFPLLAATSPHNPAVRDDVSVEIRRKGDDTLVAVRQTERRAAPGTAPPTAPLMRGVVLDASQVQGQMRGLRLAFGASSQPFHPFTLESSDDLQHWRMLKADAQLVRLEHAGQQIERSHVDWDGPAGKYLRILWRTPQQAPTLNAAFAQTRQTANNPANPVWSAPLAPTRSQNDDYEYALPGQMPLQQLRIGLPQANSLAPLTVQYWVPETRHRHRNHRPYWQTATQTVVFRLQTPQGEVTSPDVLLNLPAQARLRLVVDKRGGGLGQVRPTLQIGFVPQRLVFLARGEGPFHLAWGAQKVADSALPVTTLIPGNAGDKPFAASLAQLHPMALPGSGVSSAGAPAAVGSSVRGFVDGSPTLSRSALWAVLLAGVAVLAGMAWLLVKQMKRKADETKSES